LDGFEEVRGLDALAAGEVGDSARDLEDPVVGAGGKGQLLHGMVKQVAERRGDRAEALQVRRGAPALALRVAEVAARARS